jgi:hypothetical protein
MYKCKPALNANSTFVVKLPIISLYNLIDWSWAYLVLLAFGWMYSRIIYVAIANVLPFFKNCFAERVVCSMCNPIAGLLEKKARDPTAASIKHYSIIIIIC